MDERWKALPRERLTDSVAGRKVWLKRQTAELRTLLDDIEWWRTHSFDGQPLEGDEEHAELIRVLLAQQEARIAAMEAFLAE